MTIPTDDSFPADGQPGPVTRFFEPVAETMIGIGDLAQGSFWDGIALGGAAILVKAIYCSSFGLPLSLLLRPGSIRAILGMVCAGMAIGIVRVVHHRRSVAGSCIGTVAAAAARAIHGSVSRVRPGQAERE